MHFNHNAPCGLMIRPKFHKPGITVSGKILLVEHVADFCPSVIVQMIQQEMLRFQQ